MARRLLQTVTALVALLILLQVPGLESSRARTRLRTRSRFVGVRGWGPLTWNMSPARAMRALGRAGIRYQHESLRDQFRAGCRWFDKLRFRHGKWQVMADIPDLRLASVWLTRKTRQKNAVARLIRQLATRYGRPWRRFPPPRRKSYGRRAVWENPHSRLTVSTRTEKGVTTLMQIWARR